MLGRLRNKFSCVLIISLSSICFCQLVYGNNVLLSKCNDGFQEMANCLQYKALKMLDRLILIKKPIPIGYFFYLNHDNETESLENEITAEEKDLESGDNTEKLTEILFSRIANVARAKSLQFDLQPEMEEGRKKDKKGKGMMMMMMMGAGAMMLHGALGMIALIAGKALLVAKIALVISGIIALKKLVSHDDHDSGSQAQVIYAKTDPHSSGGGSSGWQHRSMDNAHNMAYVGQIPNRQV